MRFLLKTRNKEISNYGLLAMDKIISQKEAKAQGIPRYFTGKPCPSGHIAERRTVNFTCVECERISRREKLKNDPALRAKKQEYLREWQKKYPEKKRRLREAYKASPGYKEKHRQDAAKSRQQPGYADKQRIYNQRFKEKNSEKLKESKDAWRKANPHLHRAQAMKRKAVKIKAIARWANLQAIKDIYREAATQGMQVDHIIPLLNPIVCGLHVETNLQLLTKEENMKKSNRFNPDDHCIQF